MDKIYKDMKSGIKSPVTAFQSHQKALSDNKIDSDLQKRINRARKKGKSSKKNRVKTYAYGAKPGKSSGFKPVKDRFSYDRIIGRTH